MGITTDGWLTWAERAPGPADKVYSQQNTAQGFIPHDMVGKLAGWYSRLFDDSKYFDAERGVWRYTPNAAASIQLSVLLNGKVIQHYPFTASCWGSGHRIPNTTKIAAEHETVYRDGAPDSTIPFTAQQLTSDVRIIGELSQEYGWQPRRPTRDRDLDATLYEHTEMVRFGARFTACPSGRVAWNEILRQLAAGEEEEEMALHLVREEGTLYTFITDGIEFYYVSSAKRLKELQDAGIWPAEVEVVPKGSLAELERRR